MKKSNIRVFGETSIAHVEKRGLFSYVIVRNCDKKMLAKSFSFRKYINEKSFSFRKYINDTFRNVLLYTLYE